MSVGSIRLTADGVVGVSGKPVRVYNVVFLSGGSAGELVLRNGTSAAGTVYVQQDGAAAAKTTTLNFRDGLVFPGGCFFDKDTNVSSVVVSYEQVGS
jgi:hypothetical protein